MDGGGDNAARGTEGAGATMMVGLIGCGTSAGARAGVGAGAATDDTGCTGDCMRLVSHIGIHALQDDDEDETVDAGVARGGFGVMVGCAAEGAADGLPPPLPRESEEGDGVPL